MTSPAALAFLEDLLDDHAVAAEATRGCRRIALSQAELSRRSGRSAGTVAYYLTQAGPEVVTRRRNGIVVDLEQLKAARARYAEGRRRRDDVAAELARAWGRPARGGSELELLTEDGRTPTLAAVAAHVGMARSTAQRHLSELSAQGKLQRRGGRLYLRSAVAVPSSPEGAQETVEVSRAHRDSATSLQPAAPLAGESPSWERELAECLVDVSARLSTLAERLLDESGNPRISARNPRENGAQIAGSRDGTDAVAGGFSLKSTEKDRSLSFSSAKHQPLRAETRGEPSDREAQQPMASILTDHEIDTVLCSLMAAARERGLSDMLDRQGRDHLRHIPAEGLARAAAHIEELLRSGYPARKPMGILVKAAMTGDMAMFAVPVARPTPSDHSSRLVDAARSHAATLASIADLDDEERRYMLHERYRNDKVALAAALAVLDGLAVGDVTPVAQPMAGP